MADNQFMRGTVILLITSIILKIMGFFYQIITIRLIGTEPIGVLNMAYPFYIAFVVLATAGIPLAISKIIAEQRSLGRTASIGCTMRLAFRIVYVLGGICALLAFTAVPALFRHLGSDPRMLWSFYVLIPGIIIVPISSIIRGYFQGLQQMSYPSLGQICEQLVRLSVGLILIITLKPLGIRFIAMGLAAGMMAGELAGMLLIVFFYRRSIRQFRTAALPQASSCSSRALLAEIFALGVPTTLTRLTSSIDMAIEASLIPYALLQMGYNQSQATSLYGQFSGVFLTLLTIPMVLTGALSTALVPAISKASVAHHHQEMASLCSESLRMTYLFSLPIIAVLFFQGGALSQILFHIDNAGGIFHILTIGAVFLYLGQTSVGILQGLGMTQTVFINNLLGSIVKLVSIYAFVAQKQLGVSGIALAFVLGFIAQCLLNLLAMLRVVTIRLSISQIGLPLADCAFMLLMLAIFKPRFSLWLGSAAGPLAAIIACGLIYLALAILTRQFHLNLRQLLGLAPSAGSKPVR